MPTIQAAIDSARAGDDVLLAPGTYTWSSEGASGNNMLLITRPGITLRGEAGASSTVLDGEGRGRILKSENVESLVIEGLTFENGNSPVEFSGEPGIATHGTNGGAIRAIGNSRPTIRRSIFKNNLAAGSGSTDFGGGIDCGVAIIEDCEFTNNRAGDSTGNGGGGAISCGAAQIVRCTFNGNVVRGDGSSIGGAIGSYGAMILDCTFENNLATGFVNSGGGAIFAGGGGSIERCRFENNRASASDMRSSGGAVGTGYTSISDCIFVRNEARSLFVAVAWGGAISSDRSTIRRCVFVENTAFRSAPDGPGFGGAIRINTDGGLIERCTLLGNSGGSPQGIGGVELATPGSSVRSTIVAYTSVGRACEGGTWSCSNLFGNVQGDLICGTDGGGNFSADPQFCAEDPAGSLNVLIQSDSPCAPGNHPDGAICGLIGAGPVGCGSVSVERRSWTDIKAWYR